MTITIETTTATMGKEIKIVGEVGQDAVRNALKFSLENIIVDADFLDELVPGIKGAMWTTKKAEPKCLQIYPLKVKGRLEGTITIDQRVFEECKLRRFRATPVNDRKANLSADVYLHPSDGDDGFLSDILRKSISFSMRGEKDNKPDSGQPDMIDEANGADEDEHDAD